MDAHPFFTVIIPTYNRANLVAAAVRSVLCQTDGDFECFVVDDGSTDDTAQLLSSFKDSRLRLLLNKTNRGQHACRNQAIREARGEWICFLDSDDLYLPQRLGEIRKAIERSPQVGFWFTNAYVHRYGRIIGKIFNSLRPIPEGRVPGYYAIGDAFLPYVTTMVCLRRRSFEDTGQFREDLRILEDTELYARMFQAGLKVGVVREPLAVRFLHEGQITSDHELAFEETMEALRSAGAPPEIAAAIRRSVAKETAAYLWKSLRPRQAREFLKRELGASARGTTLYWKTFMPLAMLRSARIARRLYLKVRYHPAFAPSDLRAAAGTVELLLNPPL